MIVMNQITTTPMKIDFVSDVSCPWCVIGLKALQEALDRVGPQLDAQLHFQPFELNPQMGEQGQDIAEYMTEKYGSTAEQQQANREMIRARGEELGFTFTLGARTRTYNTFDAHRLLHWAEEQGAGRQQALKQALFKAYFTDGENPGSHAVLTRVAREVGLDAARVAQILASDEYAEEVRERENFYRQQGINSVPAIIINDKHLISGGQPVAVFEQALRQIAAAG